MITILMKLYFRRLLATFALAAALTGCQEAYLTDDIDLDLNFSPLALQDDALHLPYVAGTEVVIHAHSKKKHETTHGWRLESDNPEVLQIVHQRDGRAECIAVGAGTATINVYSDVGESDLINSSVISVREPNRVELYAHGPLLVGKSTASARVIEPTIRVGGTGTFLVRYYDDYVRLYGNGVLEPVAHESVTASPETSYLFENREWLQLRPLEAGRHTIELAANGIPVGHFPVLAVNDDAVEGVILHGESESGAHNGEWLVVLGEAVDIEGNTVYGVNFKWTLDGLLETRTGDLFRYEYEQHLPRKLTANYRGMAAVTEIHAGFGFVDTTHDVGCTATGASAGRSSALFLMLLALAPMLIFRRRERV
jgi:MYXO-CTERM domain-containing protein